VLVALILIQAPSRPSVVVKVVAEQDLGGGARAQGGSP
jgi:hypothetical protein